MSGAFDRVAQLACAAEAARAPTVHNIQPARWRFLADSRVVLFRALDRSLPVADPEGHDLQLSLGAAWEGMRLALSRVGLALGTAARDPAAFAGLAPAPGCAPVAIAHCTEDAVPDPDAALVPTRRSWRGRFAPPPPDLATRLASVAAPEARVIEDRALVALAAEGHDRATTRVMRRREYVAELRRWMRFSPRHPGWARDGLTAEALALGALECAGASVLLRWPVLRVLRTVGADALLVSEGAQVLSAAALVAFTPTDGSSGFERGGPFYRRWLALERAGLAACPMSALCDDPEERVRFAAAAGIGAGRALVNLWRVGLPAGAPARSARLPATELLV